MPEDEAALASARQDNDDYMRHLAAEIVAMMPYVRDGALRVLRLVVDRQDSAGADEYERQLAAKIVAMLPEAREEGFDERSAELVLAYVDAMLNLPVTPRPISPQPGDDATTYGRPDRGPGRAFNRRRAQGQATARGGLSQPGPGREAAQRPAWRAGPRQT